MKTLGKLKVAAKIAARSKHRPGLRQKLAVSLKTAWSRQPSVASFLLGLSLGLIVLGMDRRLAAIETARLEAKFVSAMRYQQQVIEELFQFYNEHQPQQAVDGGFSVQ